MAVAVSRLTQSGQITLPKEIRKILGVSPRQEVAFLSDGKRVEIVAVPENPLTLHSKEEFWDDIAKSEEDIKAGRVHDANEALEKIGQRYGLVQGNEHINV